MANAKESGKQLNGSKDKGRGDDDDGLDYDKITL